jgi:hypothetical protein
MKLLIILLIFNTYASHFKLLDTAPPVKKRTVRSKSSLYKNLINQNKEIKRLLEHRSNKPMIWDGTKKILTGKTFRGTLLNSILSTNLKSPVLIEIDEDQDLPSGTKFSCFGTTKNERVMVFCNKMVMAHKEVAVNTQALNLDGSSGLLGDYDDGSEDLVTGAMIASFTEGVASVATNSTNTALGNITAVNARNQLLGGVIEGARTASDIFTEDLKTKEPRVAINAGTMVLIYFMEALHDY